MSRPPRIEYPGASYYITGRALQNRDAFVDAKDFASFKSVLAGVVDRFGWELKSFVLLPDHYHLILEVPHSNLSKGMRQLNGVTRNSTIVGTEQRARSFMVDSRVSFSKKNLSSYLSLGMPH